MIEVTPEFVAVVEKVLFDGREGVDNGIYLTPHPIENIAAAVLEVHARHARPTLELTEDERRELKWCLKFCRDEGFQHLGIHLNRSVATKLAAMKGTPC